MKRWLVLPLLLVLVLWAVLRAAGDVGYWQRWAAARSGAGAVRVGALVEPRLLVSGAPGEPARAAPESERVSPEALAAAHAEAVRLGLRALVVHRHAHRVFEYFAAGSGGDALVSGGELSPLPAALAIGVLADARRVDQAEALRVVRGMAPPATTPRNPWSRESRQRFALLPPPPPLLLQDADGSVAGTLSQRVWQPLRAADAWLWGEGDAALRVDCCMVARLDDWMRVGDLLLGQGSLHGERIVSPDWIRQLLAADRAGVRHPVWLAAQAPWQGDEPPASRDTLWFDLGTDLRLWLVPRRGLAVLVWGAAGARDTLIPNIILRGLLDQIPVTDGQAGLDDLVPGH